MAFKARTKCLGDEEWEEEGERERERETDCVSHLYMRSISISGSSWNSLIFTVSDKILLRFRSSSSTWKRRRTQEAGVRRESDRCPRCGAGVCVLYLRGQLRVLHLRVLLRVGQDGAKGASQVFLLEVGWLAHQRGKRHGDLHLHSGEVLPKTRASVRFRFLHVKIYTVNILDSFLVIRPFRFNPTFKFSTIRHVNKPIEHISIENENVYTLHCVVCLVECSKDIPYSMLVACLF